MNKTTFTTKTRTTKANKVMAVKMFLSSYLKKKLDNFIMPKGAGIVQWDKATGEREGKGKKIR